MSMKRFVLWISTALLTFALGVSAAMLYLTGFVTTNGPPAVERLETPVSPPAPSCYPGLSIQTGVTGKLSYFPPGVLSEHEWSDEFRAGWYAKHLRAMNEASFYFPENGDEERYRFLWLRSFHHPVVVRIWNSGGEQFVNVKEMSGAGGYEPGKLIVNQTLKIAKGEWDEFRRLLEQTCYWELPTEDERAGFDGAQWILEGVKGGRYHVVDRWTPEKGSYREACLYALKLSGLRIDASHEDVY
jgi:hypothetical protein